jgi:hypothetical protein
MQYVGLPHISALCPLPHSARGDERVLGIAASASPDVTCDHDGERIQASAFSIAYAM